MKHTFLDLYREGNSPVHRLDARIKLVATLGFVLAASLLVPGYWPGYLALAAFGVATVSVARVPLRVALGRSLVAVPFALMAAASLPFVRPGRAVFVLSMGSWHLVATDAGCRALAEVLARAWVSILVAGLLTATTPFSDLLAALQSLGLPRLLVALVSFLYRYLFVLVDEAERLWRAREARSARVRGRTSGGVAWRARVLGGLIGSLFIRSYERSERVYQAMLARGFEGEIRSLAAHRAPARDLWVGLALLMALAALVASGYAPWWGG
ncbi:MAG: cobalt ECF transporter T component CbiQ [Anaerolineae bacterium]|nr:cobalt ECF transporter T component CbiQ [Anaerolineae bacterium]